MIKLKMVQIRNREFFLDVACGIYKYPTANILVNNEMLKVLLSEIRNETMSALIVFIEHCTDYPNHCGSTRIKDIRSLL